MRIYVTPQRHQPDPTCSSASVGKTGDVALLCFGDTNGTGTFTASGGTAPYTLALQQFSWGNHEHDSDHVELTNGGVGSITVKVTDANLCKHLSDHQPDQPAAALALGKTGDVALLCFWRYEWYSTSQRVGGTAPYTFSITSNSAGATTSTTATTLSFTNGGVGSITVKVTDANLCNTSATINLTNLQHAALGKTGDVALLCLEIRMVQAHSQRVEAQPLTHLALPAIQLGQPRARQRPR